MLIVLAEQLDVPLIDVYHGALLPGALLVGLHLCFVFLVTMWKPGLAPPTASARQGDSTVKYRGWVETAIAAGTIATAAAGA